MVIIIGPVDIPALVCFDRYCNPVMWICDSMWHIAVTFVRLIIIWLCLWILLAFLNTMLHKKNSSLNQYDMWFFIVNFLTYLFMFHYYLTTDIIIFVYFSALNTSFFLFFRQQYVLTLWFILDLFVAIINVFLWFCWLIGFVITVA